MTATAASPLPASVPVNEPSSASLAPLDSFPRRHIGPSDGEIGRMLETIGAPSLEALVEQTIPEPIRLNAPIDLQLGEGWSPSETLALARLREHASKNTIARSFIGMGYHGTLTPGVILRNVLENPGWYTQYTPYQAEIAQGRLEALVNFQTMIADLTGLPLAGASLLDEATAAAEAMAMVYAVNRRADDRPFFASRDCHPQTLAVLQTRARHLGIDLVVDRLERLDFSQRTFAGVLVQYPATDGSVRDFEALISQAHEHGAMVVMASDPLSLALLKPPGEMGADIAVGSTQRFGVPMGAGGPHAAYIATHEQHARKMPGRIIGLSKDALGNPAFRMAIQTREQHIRRDKATSNICTAQALLAIVAGMYGVYHGPDGIRAIAQRVHDATRALASGLRARGHDAPSGGFFDTLRITPAGVSAEQIRDRAQQRNLNFRYFANGSIGITLDETVSTNDLGAILSVFDPSASLADEPAAVDADSLAEQTPGIGSSPLARTSAFMTHPVFNTHHSETEMLRYIFKLQGKDLSLAHSMIALGSCTMKLNATSEMAPISWPELAEIHPFAPADQLAGYGAMLDELERWLAVLTGFTATSLQPNAGAQGEYAGLLTIRAYHESRGEGSRDVCLIPTSAHGTNPASAIMAGCRVVPIACDDHGNIDIDDLRTKADTHKADLAAIMVTYPSTHGVFEQGIREICQIVHDAGGMVYMDGANLNAQLGLTTPGACGADVCHLNLHKTFCIPHGGGGPGMGPICVNDKLAPFLPGHPVSAPRVSGTTGSQAIGPVSAAPYGSPLICAISWMYIVMMGAEGLTKATEVAILSANYMAKRLEGHFDVLFRGASGRVAHEFILDTRPFEKSAGIKADDIAKRLMDYGFHAPTMSWPVAGTLMIEPTESESLAELDRFCDAMIGIRNEIRAIEESRADKDDNVLRNAPHPMHAIGADDWSHPYSRSEAAFPEAAPWLKDSKFWPAVARIDNPYGDRNLFCTCPPVEDCAVR